MFEQFSKELYQAFQRPLPGEAAHQALKPYLSIHKNLDVPPLIKPKLGAVMALIYPVKNEPHLLFIERPVYDGVHSGQIAFPGGKIEKKDASYLDAALRETQEEIGVHPDKISVVGQLSNVFVFASNFMVYPYVGILQEPPLLVLEEKEVASILQIPIHTFLQPEIIKEKPIKNALGFTLMAPYYDIEGKVLWGATAMMVSELCEVIKKGSVHLP
ncbi:MAG: CoA pyrophosphatase [Sphingobacteriales bacterium]|nr:CoA pyrophosphatase [Sphingobacteriales bacterium]